VRISRRLSALREIKVSRPMHSDTAQTGYWEARDFPAAQLAGMNGA